MKQNIFLLSLKKKKNKKPKQYLTRTGKKKKGLLQEIKYEAQAQ
jgi:hypothetical protein